MGDADGFPQESDVRTLRFHQRLVGEHVAIGGDSVEQHALTGVAQRLPARPHLQFRDANAIGGLESVEERLRHRNPNGPRLQSRGLDGVVRQQVADLLQSSAQAGNDLWAIAR